MKSLKKFAAIKFPNKEEITNEDIESLLTEKYSKKNSPEFREKIYNLDSKLKKYKSEVKTKMRELKELQASS
jgi:cell division ATPase FtsA